MSPASPASRLSSKGLWRDVFRGQTYLNLVYLLLSFPLGLTYFVVLVTVGALGVGLIIILVGALILALLLLFCWAAIELERHFARVLLGLDVRSPALGTGGDGIVDRAKAIARERATWTGMLFLAIKFPLGLVSFVVTVFVVATVSALITSPLTFIWWPVEIMGWRIDSVIEAAVGCSLGVVLLPFALAATNLLARLAGLLAQSMLSANAGTSATARPSEAG